MEKHILVIEDESDIRTAIADALAQAGFRVNTAENGARGLELALAEHPDIILIDLIMPIMDGHATIAKLRTDPWGREAKIIVLTSMDNVEHVATAHEGNITDYIIKVHHSLDEIVNKVRLALYTE